MSCAAGSTWPLPFQDALIAVAVTFALAAGAGRAARSVVGIEADEWMQVDGLIH
jgi:hypothetical protein